MKIAGFQKLTLLDFPNQVAPSYSHVHICIQDKIDYGSAGRFGFQLINAVIGSFKTIYFANVAFLDAGIIATIIASSKIFDGISDLIVGNIVDRTKSPIGKGRIWLFRMCIPFAIGSIFRLQKHFIMLYLTCARVIW